MPTHNIALDMNKSAVIQRPEVRVRVGERGTQTLRVSLYDDGIPYTPTGDVLLQIKKPNGGLVRSKKMTKQGNVLTCVIPSPSFTYHGIALRAYLAEYRNGAECATSSEFKLTVLPGTTDEEDVLSFDEQINQMVENAASIGSDVAQNEAARQQAERERAAAEQQRQSAETARGSAETKRESAEQERKTAETARDTAEKARDTAEKARDAAETERDSAESARGEAEEQREQAETDRDTAEKARDAAEKERDAEEKKRAAAETERKEAEEKRVDAEAARVGAETERETAEQEREEAETARAEAETKRDTAETERQHYEDQRRTAEIERQKAEVQRNANETTRKRQEDERVAADELRAQQQAKNNADQAANNLAAQGQQRVFLVEDQFDPVTRIPTLDGEFGIIYCVPKQNPEEADQYTEWIVTYGADGSKRWERVGTSDMVLPDAITTDQIDQIVDTDAMLQSAELQNASSLSYFWQKIKGWVNNAIKSAPAKQPDPRALRAKLAEANAAKESAVVASLGSDYDFGTIVTQQADYDTFCAAIDAAQAVYDEHYSQEELDDATATLDEALQTFKAASHEVTPDKSAWNPLVESHTTYKSDVKESEDGSDVRNGEQWATPADWSTYDAAFEKANGEVEGATKQSQIDSAVSELTQAEEAFGEAIQTAKTSTDALQEAIAAANAAMDGVKTSADGSDVYDFERWATEDDFATFRAVIASATETLSSGCSQDELDEATSTLDAATGTFEALVQDGLKHIQYGALDSLIEECEGLQSSTVTSETEGADVSIHSYWTTQEQRETFDAAVSSAQSTRSSAKTQEEVDEAVGTLTTAKETFEGERQPGLMPIDLQELDRQLTAARKAMSDTYESEDGSDVPNGKQWTTSEHRQTLQAAITEAERIRSESTQQDEVDAEAKTLEAAVTAYNATLQTAKTSTTALSEAIEAATQAKAGVVESADGTDVYESGRWVTHETMEALTQAIETAQGVLSSGCSQDDLDAAVQTLTEATSTFSAAIKNGTKIDYTKLDAAITAANEAKQDVTGSEDGKDVEFGSKWATASDLATFDEAIETAQGVRASAANQAAADEAATTLEAATEAFTPKVKTAAADTSALDAAISAANTAKQDVQTSDQEGEDLPAGSRYVTSEQMSTFEAAIQTATTAKTESTTQAQLDAATSTLTSATATFSGQVQQNLKIPQSSEELEAMSWEEISQLSAVAAEDPTDFLFMVDGDHKLEKTVKMTGLSGVTDVKARIIGVGQDKGTSGETLGLTFQLCDGLEYSGFTMNSSAVTTGGWRDSLMRSTNLPKVEAALPSDLKGLLKTMVKKTNVSTSGSTMTETQDKLALLSCVEVFGPEQGNYGSNSSGYQSWYPLEGEWYQWYKNHNTDSDRVIKRASGSARDWWLRSVQSSQYFARVYLSGIFNWNSAIGTNLPCACFSV